MEEEVMWENPERAMPHGYAEASNVHTSLPSLDESVKKHVRYIYAEIRNGDTLLSRKIFKSFLETTQGVERMLPDSKDHNSKSLDFDEFFWLWSRNGLAWRAAEKTRQVDATHPISHYFINSSHNTYLEKNHGSSISSAETYRAVGSVLKGRGPRRLLTSRQVLKNGCRCIEIDVWNGPGGNTPSGPAPRYEGQTSQSLPESHQRGEPIVCYYGSMTSAVPFRDVCRAIRESAFENNIFPVIIDLKVGADEEQQEVMVDIMKEKWGHLLLDRYLDDCHPDMRQPRLEELYNKILIKPNRLVQTWVTGKGKEREITPWSSIHAQPICDALADLAIYTCSQDYIDDNSLDIYKSPNHILNINENIVLSLAAQEPSLYKFITHNRDFLTRMCPVGIGFKSSNPDPSFPWHLGVQMVALNWQRSDDPMILNDAMFAGTKGWLLKPHSLLGSGYVGRNPATTTASTLLSNTVPQYTLDLHITVFAAQSLALYYRDSDRLKEMADRNLQFRPEVEVEVHFGGEGNRNKSVTERTVAAQTEHPDWGREAKTMHFRELNGVVEEFTFVR
jgi:hypothetical protein